ncbi:MAG: GNAT family N-acetyltransferase [Bernardetiaceae bacterium]|nr:GNAT family N-acetyltransferase [Bernardetiaceae bacterium]
MELTTNRLRIIPLNLHQLMLLKEDRELLEHCLGLEPINLRLPEFMEKEHEDFIEDCIELNRESEQLYPLHTHWEVILDDENHSIGGVDLLLKDDGHLVLSYFIDSAYRNRGYAKELVAAICEWIFQHPQVKSITAYTPPGNVAPQAVLKRNGFINIWERSGNICWRLKKNEDNFEKV